MSADQRHLELASRNQITVADHTNAARKRFNALEADLREALPTLVKDIQHIGGTAVGGLVGSATVDALLITPSLQTFDRQRLALPQLGFLSLGDGGISSQRLFALDKGSACKTMLYVCEPGARSALHHLLLRDYLRHNPAERNSFSALKQRLAEQYVANPPRYVAGKRPRLRRLLEQATGRR